MTTTDIATDAGAAQDSAPRAPRLWRRLGRAAIDIVLPPLCLGCHTQIADHDALCAACWRRVDFIRPPLCDRLGLPLPFDTGGVMISAEAASHPPIFDRTRAVARHDGLMRDLIHAFKFRDTHDPRRLFARWMRDAGRDLLADADLLVPVPLNRLRLMWRRYNQAQILAAGVARLSGVPARPLALTRQRRTSQQVGLTRLERQKNVAGAFTVPASAVPLVSGKAIVLVDDVITTGATAAAAAGALKKAGARRVDVLALALVAETVS